MSQQINLFNPIFRRQKKHFSAVTMAQGLGLVLAGSFVVFLYARVHLATVEQEAAESSEQLKQTTAQLTKVVAAYAPRAKDKSLEEEVRRMEAELKSQQQAYDMVMRGGLGNTKGYSEYFRAFARQIVNGVWLTGFTIDGAGNDIELKGRALQPELVPNYINRLKQETVMQGKSFATLAMDVPEIDAPAKAGKDKEEKVPEARQRVRAPYVEFSLRSSDQELGTGIDSPAGQVQQDARGVLGSVLGGATSK